MSFDPRLLLLFAVGSYSYVIFARLILGWFPFSPPDALRPAFNFLFDVTEPFLRIFRRLLPPVNMGGMGLDLSPILAFLVLVVVRSILARVLFPGQLTG